VMGARGGRDVSASEGGARGWMGGSRTEKMYRRQGTNAKGRQDIGRSRGTEPVIIPTGQSDAASLLGSLAVVITWTIRAMFTTPGIKDKQ
jgi:hypothetical protein